MKQRVEKNTDNIADYLNWGQLVLSELTGLVCYYHSSPAIRGTPYTAIRI